MSGFYKNSLIGATVFVLLIALGGLYNFLASEKRSVVRQLTIGEAVLEVEIVDTPNKRTRGLSGRASLPEDKGMLFLFGEPGNYGFWMRGMRFSLDIIWIKGDRIVGIEKDITHIPPDLSYPLYYPPEAIDKVLEINAGFADKIGIAIGDRISF